LLQECGDNAHLFIDTLSALTKVCLVDMALIMQVYVTEREKNLQFLISLNQKEEVGFSVNQAVKSLAVHTLDFLDFDTVELVIDSENELLTSFHCHSVSNKTPYEDGFHFFTEKSAYKLRSYFKNNDDVLWLNEAEIKKFTPEDSVHAKKSFKTCIVFPVSFQERPFGIIAFFSKTARIKQTQTLQILEGVSRHFSLLIARHSTQSFYHHNLKRLALYDSLTGLPNRSLFIDRLDQAMKRTKRAKGFYTALFFIDIDNFKDINDTMGHSSGDAVLKAFGRCLTSYLREEDTASRIGGDEFLVLACGLQDEAHAREMSQRILNLCTGVYKVPKGDVYVSVSVGGLILSDEHTDIQQIMQKVDIAAFQAKKEGKGRVVLFLPEHQKQFLEEKKMIQDMEIALRDHQFCLYYQPVININTGQIASFEALIRWIHPKKGIIAPGKFIPIAESMPLILKIGLEVLSMALRDITHFIKDFNAHPSLHISINLSSKQLAHEEHFQNFLSLIDANPQVAKHLRIEITESSFAHNTTLIRERLESFKERGIKTLIDDFGTGYSSLSYLRQFDFDYLKIDRSFVQDVASCDKSLRLLKSVIDLAHGQGIQIIAEGVETKTQLDLLQKKGCHLIQGFYFAQALPSNQIHDLLKISLENPSLFKDKALVDALQKIKSA
jgi:diguanylate cyclase (GGDEF)-like protein